MRTALILGCLLPLASRIAFAQNYFPLPPDPIGNPTTPQKALLGKALFWDEQLSASRTVACGTCHIFGHGGTDPRSASPTHPGKDGILGNADDIRGSLGVVLQDANGDYPGSPVFGVRPQSTGRRAPPVINAAYESLLFWDGRAAGTFLDPVTGAPLLTGNAALESQAAGPPVSDVEMSHVGRSWTDIATDLAPRAPLALADNIPANLAAFVVGQTYANLFAQVFGSAGVTPERILYAIAAYERTLIADQTPYDDYLAGTGTLTVQEQNGLNVFSQFCMTCHTDTLPGMHGWGPGLHSFKNIGVRPEGEDTGRFAVSGLPFQMGAFKTPQIRNVELRAPYMHNGGLASLGQVVDFYNRGGDFGANIDPSVAAIAGQITPQMRLELVAFMRTLTDPRVALELPPFDRPRLWSEGTRVPDLFGTGRAGTGGFVPAMLVATPPFVGNAKFRIGVDRALPGVAAFLALDLVGSQTPIPLLGHDFHLGLGAAVEFAGLTQGLAAGEGWATHALSIPPASNLTGLPLFGQWLLLDPMGPSGLTSSGAFGLTVF